MRDRNDGGCSDAATEASALAAATRTTVLLLALGSLLVGSWRCLSSTHGRRLGSRSQRPHERLQKWEGEGGRPDPEPEEPGASADATTPGPV